VSIFYFCICYFGYRYIVDNRELVILYIDYVLFMCYLYVGLWISWMTNRLCFPDNVVLQDMVSAAMNNCLTKIIERLFK